MLVPLLVWAFADRWFAPALWPQELGLRGFRALGSGGAGSATATSIAVSLAATAVTLLLAWPAGRALGLARFRGREVLRLVLLAPVLFPAMATALGMHAGFIRLGLADALLGVVLSHIVPALPYAVATLAASFEGFDARYEDVARSLGCARTRIFFSVTLPLMWPGLVTAGLFAFLVSWSQYALTLVMGGGVVVTLPVLLFGLASGGDLEVTAAATLAFLFPAMALMPITARVLGGSNLGGRG
ncbi:MAG: ABC transporter permease subunit [Myxococcaceae bacterium]